MKRTHWWAPVMLALAGGSLLAQGEPSAPPEAADACRLAYRWVPGRQTRLVMRMKGDMTMAMEGGPPGAPNEIPMTIDSSISMLQKVLGAKNGVGTVATNVDSMRFLAEMLGMSMVMKFQNGKLTMSMNGQQMPLGGGPPGLGGVNPQDLRKPVTMRIDRMGKVLSTRGGGPFATAITGVGQTGLGPSGFNIQLPNRLVAVGDMWEESNRVKMPLAMPGGPGAGAGGTLEVAVRANHTLREILTKGARRLAVIGTEGEISVPEGAAPAGPMTIEQYHSTMEGTSYFDLGRGEVTSSAWNVTMAMSMTAAGGAPQGGGAQQMRMSIDGALKITTRTQPVTTRQTPARRSTTGKR